MKKMIVLLVALGGAIMAFFSEATAQDEPIIDTESSSVGQNVSAEELKNLPLNGRNFQLLINTVPGVLTDQLPAQSTGQALAGGTPYVIDGVAITDPVPAGSDPTSVNLDAIEDIQVQTGGFEAEFGRATGGVINIVTKTGSNEFRSGGGGPFNFTLNEGVGGTCLESIGGVPQGNSTRGTIKFDVPFEVPKNFFRGQPLGPGGSIYFPPCDDAEGRSFFFQGNFPLPGTPTHTVLTPTRGYNIDLKPLIRAGFSLDRSLVDGNFAVGSGSSYRMDWSKDFKLSLYSSPRLDWKWKYNQSYDSEAQEDLIFINKQYSNNTPSACPNANGKVFGFQGGGWKIGAAAPLQPYALDPATCEEIRRSIDQFLDETEAPLAALGGPIVKDQLWFFAGGTQLPEADQPPPDDEILGVEHALRPEFVVGLNLTYKNFSEILDNVPAVDLFRPLQGVQSGALELRNVKRIGGVELREAPGGGERLAHDAESMIYIEALGGPTGEVYQVTIVGDAALDMNGYAAIEPVEVSSDEREEIVEQLSKAPGPRRTLKTNGYCRDFLEAAPLAGAVFRLAGAAAQAAFEPEARVLEAARQLYEQGLLDVDSNPDAYFHSIRQWALWTVTEGFEQSEFIDAFSKQVRENLEGGGTEWTDQVAAAVRRHAESRWGDIQQVLEVAQGS
jgi:hypothetical protein